MATFDTDDNRDTETEDNNTFGDQEGNNQNTNKENHDNDSFVEYNGKKMSREDVLKKLENADQFIDTMKSERQTDRERIEKLIESVENNQRKSADMEDILERLNGQNNAGDKNDRNTVDEDQLAERAANAAYDRMTREQQERQKKENQKQVSARLKERYGDKVDDEVFAITRELGYSDEEAYDLAGQRPKAFLRMVGLDQNESKSNTTASRGSVRTPQSTSEDSNKERTNVLGAKNATAQHSAWEARIQDKLNQLGINN